MGFLESSFIKLLFYFFWKQNFEEKILDINNGINDTVSLTVDNTELDSFFLGFI